MGIKYILLPVFIVAAICSRAQEGAPVIMPAPQLLPAAQARPKPAVLPAPAIGGAPFVGSAPVLGNAPVVQNAPVIMSAPKSMPAPSVGGAPSVQSAPHVVTNNAVFNGLGVSRSADDSNLIGGGNIIDISAEQKQPAIPRGTVQVTFEADDKLAAKPAEERRAKQQAAAQDKAVAGLKAWDGKLTSLSTSFEQKTTYDGADVSSSSGKLFFAKPNKIRLEGFNADGKTTQITLTDKKKIKIFDANMKLVKTYKWKEWFDGQSNKALFDFGNYAALFKNNDVTNFEDNKDGTATLTLEPVARDQKIFITVSQTNYFPTAIAVEVDQMLTTTTLNDTVINGEQPDNLFQGLK